MTDLAFVYFVVTGARTKKNKYTKLVDWSSVVETEIDQTYWMNSLI